MKKEREEYLASGYTVFRRIPESLRASKEYHYTIEMKILFCVCLHFVYIFQTSCPGLCCLTDTWRKNLGHFNAFDRF